jgi:hypothetical protein
VTSRVVALVVVGLLGCVCFAFALFALWPPLPGRDPVTGRVLAELMVVGASGVGATTTLRWALGRGGRSAVLLGWVAGLAPCLAVVLALLGS